VTGRWFSPGPPVSSTNKTDRHDIITEILLKVALSTIKQTTNICLSTDTGLDQRVDSKEMLIDTSDYKYIKYTYL
jgi:hypothetical protein